MCEQQPRLLPSVVFSRISGPTVCSFLHNLSDMEVRKCTMIGPWSSVVIQTLRTFCWHSCLWVNIFFSVVRSWSPAINYNRNGKAITHVPHSSVCPLGRHLLVGLALHLVPCAGGACMHSASARRTDTSARKRMHVPGRRCAFRHPH